MLQKVKKWQAKQNIKNKWQAENCERISLVVKKGKKQIIRDFALKQGDTLNSFINKAIDEAMRCDNNKITGN